MRLSAFEPLEDRRLLAVTPLSPSEAAALRETTAAVASFAARLESFGALASSLPISSQGIGSLADIDAAFGESFATPMHSYLSNTATPTQEGLKQVVDQAFFKLPSGSLTIIDNDDLLSFQFDGTFQRSVDLSYDLAQNISPDLIEFEGTLSAKLNVTLNFNITIGIDRTQASAAAGAFVEFADATGENNLSASLDLSANTPIKANLGFLSVTLANPESSAVALSLNAKFDTVAAQVNLAELTAADLTSVATVVATGNFNLNLPVQTDLNGLGTINSSVSIADTNLFDAVAPTFNVDAGDLSQFRTLSANAFFNGLQQIQNTFGGLDIFDTEIPFTGGKTLNEVLNIGAAFGAKITGPAADPDNEEAAGFGSAQEFRDKSADAIQYIPAANGKPAMLIFDVSFDHLFNVATFPIDFGAGIGELSIQADSTLRVDAGLAAALEIGVKLEQPGASFGLGDNTLLSTLQGGIEIPSDAGVSDAALKDDIRITLRDGTSPTRIDIQQDWTISDLKAALVAAGLVVTYDEQANVTYDPSVDPESSKTFKQGLILVDPTESVDGSQLKIEMLNGSLVGAMLGLFGQGKNGIELDAENKPIETSHGLRTGPLHGQSLANSIFVRPKAGESMFTATASLSADINGAGKLGFVEIAIEDGTAVGSLKTEFTPTYPSTTETDGRIDGAEVVELASAAKLRLQGQRAVKFGEAYSGELQIDISKADGSTATLELAYSLQPTSTMADLLLAMNAQLALQGADGNLVRVVSSGGKLNFFLTDGVGRFVTIKPKLGDTTAETEANRAAAAKLGIKEDLSGFVATPKLSGSAYFDLPFQVDLNLGSFSLTAHSGTISFAVPDLTIGDFKLPEGINLDDLGLGGDGYLKKLKSLDRATIMQALQDGLDLLRKSVEQSPLFSQPLPMLNVAIRDVLDISDSFAEIIANLNGTEASGLGQLDEIFEDIFGVAESNGGGTEYPEFAVWALPALNSGLVFDGVALDSIDAFPSGGKEFRGENYTNLIAYLGALQANKADFGVRLDESGDDLALRIDLPFDIGDGFGVENQVDPLGFEVPIGLDLADLDISGLSNLVDARGDALVSAFALGQINLSVGIELREAGAPRPFLYDGVTDGTSLGVLVRAAASPFAFDVALGPIGASLTGGSLLFDGDKLADPQNNRYASFSVGITNDNGDGRHYFDEIVETVSNGLELSDFEFSGDFDASLTAQLDFSGLPIGPYTFAASVGGSNLTDLLSSLNVTINGDDPAVAFTDLKDALAEDFNLLALVGGWDGAFDLIIDAMEGEVFGVELPFIGDKLKDQASFLRDIKESVSGNFSNNADNQANNVFTNIYQDVRDDLYDAIGPQGLGLLKDLSGDGIVSIDDILIEQLYPGIGFQILLGNDLGQLELPIDFDLGIPGLNLDIDANVTGTLGFELGLHFGVNLDHGFFIDTTDSFMQVFVDVGVPGLSASGELGFLRVDANLLRDNAGNLSKPLATIGDGQPLHSQFTIESKVGGSAANFDVRVVGKLATDINDFEYNASRRVLTLRTTATSTATSIVNLINTTPALSGLFTATLATGSNGTGIVAAGQRAVGVANSFAGRFTVDILDPGQTYDGLLTFSEIMAVKSYKDILDIDATANAALDLHLLASFGGSNSFPSLQTDLLIDWQYLLGEELQFPQVEFKDISLDVGQFFSGFAGKVLEEANNILEPVRPIINFLTEPVPVVSDLAGGSITMLDLLKLEGGKVEKAARFIESVADFDRILQNIPDLGDGKLLNMGDATYTPGAGFIASDSVDDVAARFKDLAPASSDGDFDPDDFLKSASELEDAADNKIKLGFPLLDPSNIMGLLSGKVINLFTLELPTLELDAGIKKYFPLPIFPAVGVELGGAVSAQADFAFGFDTFGIQQFLQTGDFEDVFNGFFVWDHETADGGGADISEVQLKAQITAAAALNAGFFKASVGGGLFANIDFNLHDNNDDGKVRLVELLDNTLLGAQDGFGPIHIFDVTGKLDAGLFAEITIGIGPFSYTEEFDLASATIFSFEFPRPAGEGVALAQMNGTTLELNIGDNANRRLFFFTDDVAEDYRLFPGPQPGSVVVEAFGRSQIYTGVSRITGNAGMGNDKIVASADLSIPLEISGGAGNDMLYGGAADDVLSGGDGNDDIRGGLGNDQLSGDAGKDSLNGEAGDDLLKGGSGADALSGGDGDDFIRGEDGDDTIHAGSGNDIVYAGLGFDTIYGEAGDDEIYGEADSDFIDGGTGGDMLYGNEGDDRILGNDGNDIIRGGIGNDVLLGGNGNDTLYGDEGDDQLRGETGRDVIYGGAGNDLLEGGLGSDDLYGGLGNDKIYFNVSDTSQADDARHLLVGGGGDDWIMASTSLLEFDNTIYGDGINAELGAIDNTLDGHDTIYGGKNGRNTVYGGGGNDVITTYVGDDFIDAGAGDDKVYAGAGNDFVIGGYGDDQLFGQAGKDVLWGGFAPVVDPSTVTAGFELPPRYENAEAAFPTGFVPALITPTFVQLLSLDGIEGDGRDTLDGGDDNDMLFGGADADVILGGAGADYIDGGAGNDNADGGSGNDVMRGGGNNDVLRGGDGIDHILGDSGDDQLFGDAGIGASQLGQRLFGGVGSDTLYAYAPDQTSGQFVLHGDQLFGDADGDTLNGNLRREILVGGAGDDLLRGDYLSGPTYRINASADQSGGADRMFGEGGEDKLFGGGGNDEMWGGSDTDYLDGQQGSDTMYGGGGNDLFVVSAMNSLQSGIDTIEGHFGNFPGDNAADDDATDVLIINGSQNDDIIGLSQTIAEVGQQPQLRIDYKSGAAQDRTIFVNVRNSTGKLLVEQFQVAGLAGDDIIGFAGVHPSLLPLKANTLAFDVTEIAARGDWTSTLEGNSGNDTIIGSKGRDRAAGGPGSDTIYGFAGDDRLIGDNGDGFTTDEDRLYAGQGNDDLTGGQGTNYLYSWSLDPGVVGDDFGIFVDDSGNLVSESAGGTLKQENTGLNRMLGNEGTDHLYGGTLLDFMYGRGGANTLYRSNGTPFESLGDTIPGDEWKEYAKETGQVWYVSGTNANDEIGVNFVTEPGLLSDHHLITRLTDNNGNVTFDAQVRLDFAATDADGNAIWTPNDLLADYAALRSLSGNEALTDLDKLEIKRLETNLVNKLLPPEGDFQAIIIDALAGNDKIIVGPTVQKSVWIDAGDGDDVVTIRGGRAILADKAEIGKTNGLMGRNDIAGLAYPLSIPVGGVQFDALTFDHATDIDWFKFTLPATAGTLNVKTASPIDALQVQIFAADGETQLASATGLQFATLNLNTFGLEAGTEYLLRIQTNKTPTIYGIEFDFGIVGPVPVVDLGTRSDAVRRDIILGGRGNDILMGGPGEDWILGGDGNDVISGGLDRGSPDLLIGGAGDDTFQIIPDRLPLLGNQPNTVFEPASRTYLPTMNDEIDGSSGDDRILYAGGNLDRRGFEVPDFAALRYNTGFHRYEFTSLVWDIGQQKFLRDYVDTNGNGRQDANEPDLATYQRQYLFYQSRNIENTQIELQAGDDTFHADPSYVFPGTLEEWGIKLGNYQQVATEAGLNISGGPGTDHLFGGALDDKISGGPGDDIIFGSQGNDDLLGGGGNDQVFGMKDTSATPLTPRTPNQVIGRASFGFSEEYRYELVAPFFALPEAGRPGVQLNNGTSEQLVSEAFGFEGATANERLSTLRTIGDFNGDGYEDFIASSDTTSYILFGPVQLDAIERIDQVADIIIDHAAFGRPATSQGDMNGDGKSDLAFVRIDAGTPIVTVVFGGETMDAGPDLLQRPWQRVWGQDFVTNYVNKVGSDSSFRTLNLAGPGLPERLNLHVLDMTGDGKDDLVVLAESTDALAALTTSVDGSSIYVIGYAFSGATIHQFVATTADPHLTAYDHLAIIGSKEASTNIQATVVGDVNGDGIDELLFGNRLMTTSVTELFNVPSVFSPLPSSFMNGYGSTDITIIVNELSTKIKVVFAKQNNTLEAIVDQINQKIAVTDLAGMVFVDIDSNSNLRFQVSQGFEASLTVIGDNTNPLSIRQNFQFGTIYTITESQPILDHSTITSTGNIVEAYSLIGTAIDIAVKHTFVGDLSITLVSPTGQRIKLADRVGSSGDNFGTFDDNGNVLSYTRFRDAAATPIASGAAPFTSGDYKPEEPLSSLIGQSLFGEWKLEITDSSNGDIGELVRWRFDVDSKSNFPDNNQGLRGREVDQQGCTVACVSPFLTGISDNLRASTTPPSGYTTRGRFAITINSFGSESGTPYALGDLNNDGRNDFAIVGAIAPNLYTQTSIFLGRADRSVPTEPDAYISGRNSVLTSGDFDGDGKRDLAGTTASSEQSSLFVIHNVAEFFQSNPNSEGRFEWNVADTIIPYVDEFQSTRRLSTVDLNGDGIDDISISSSLAESQNGNIQAGQVYVAYGALKQVALPTAGIFDIENFSVPGSGSFVVNPETGRSEVFSDAGKPFSLSSAADEKWFRFTTLGDGKPGDAIRWLPETEAVTLIAEQPVNSPRRRAQDLDVEFWTRASDTNIEQSTKLPHVSIQGTGDGTYDYYKFTATAGSRAIFDIDNNNFDTELFLFDENGLLLAFNDDGAASGGDENQGSGVASYLEHTFTNSGTFVIGVAKYNSSASGGEITGPAPAVGDVYRLNVSVDRHQVLGPVDLIDADGGVVAANQSVFDLRHVPAGTYYLRVHDTVSTFTFEFNAPSRGQFAGTTTLPDRDWIDGGDGDDVLVGNNDIDRIFGGSGADTITAEPLEIRDSTPGDVYVEVPTIERISRDVRPIIDPLVETGNAALNRAIASALGKPIVWDASGIPQIYGGVHASELASISTLDASGLGIQTYQGLEHLTNLQSLDISNNRVATQNGTFFGGHYAIVSENTDILLSFGSSVTISGLAIYNGYANRDDGTYTLRDGAGHVIGSWTISGTTGATNEGVDSFWLVFNSPITTSSLSLHADSLDGTTVSYREIEVFQAGATNRPNVGPAAGHLRINAGSSFYLAAHQTETGDNMSSNPDVTSGLGGTRIAYTPTGTFPISGGQNGAAQLNNGDVSLANFDTLVGLSNLRALDLSGNSRVTNVQRLSELSNLQSIDLRGTEVWVSAFFPTEYFLSLDLKQLHLSVTGLSTDEHNLTAPQGTTVNLTKAVAGNWIVLGPNSSSFSGSGTTITFTADHAGIYRVYPTGSAAEAIFPFLVTNVAPVISGAPQVVNIDEGDSRTVNQLLAAAGLTISDAGSTPPTRQATVTDSSGVVTDLTTGSLAMNDDVIRLDPAILDGASDVSVAFWMQTSATNAPGILSAASTITGTNPSDDNEFLIASSGGNRIIVYYKNAVRSFLSSTPFNNNAWHHFVVVRNDSNDTISVYLNGQQLGAAQSIPLGTLSVAANGFVIGQEQDSVGGGFDPTQALNGKLDDLAIWRRVLTPSQISEIFSKGVVGTEADLAAYYPLNELGSDIAHDRSSNGRNGVIASIDAATPVVWSPDSQFAVRSFQPLNEGDFTLTVVAHDLQGASARAEAMIQVINVAPTAVMTPLNTGTVVAGQSVQFNALASTYPGVNDALSYFWEVLYDGSPADFVSSESDFAFTPAFAGSYEVKLTVTDSAGAASTVTSNVAVNPSIPVVANHTGNEGDVFVFDTDGVSPKAATATRTYLWRVLAGGVAIDTGTAATNNSTFAFAAPDDDSYTVELTITDTIDLVSFSTTQIVSTVVTSNVAPTIAFGATTFVTEGTQVILAPAIFDAGSADALTYLWTIVDENSNAVPLTTPGNLASVGFIPQDNGTYTATLTVTDDDGAATLPTSTTIIVANAAPVVEPASNRQFGGNLEFDEGTNQNHATLFFYFSEAGPLDFNSPFTYHIDFGDGTQEQGTQYRNSPDYWPVLHTYADSGVYIVTLTLIDKDGAAGTATRRVAINNLAPQNVTVSGPATADEDTTVSFTGTAADIHNFIPGSSNNEPLRALVDFGDGTVLPTTLRPRLNLVAEVEPNNTYATGQNLETLSWSNAYNPATQYGQGPHVSVRGTGNGTDDWYRFVVEQSDYAEISVRDANFDAVLSLVNVATGTLTTGEIWNVRPDWIQFGSNETAEYAILVQRSDGAGGVMPLQPGDDYIIDFVVHEHEFVTLPFEELRNYDFTARHVYANSGTYNVTVTVLDDDGGRTTSPMSTIVIADTTAPSVSGLAVTPNPRNTVVGEIDITFSKPISGFNLSDLTLTRDGGANLLTGSAATLTNLGGGNWRLGNLAGLTAIDGSYALQLIRTGSGIVDSRGLELSNNLQVLWTADFVAPTVTVDSLTTINNRPRLSGTVDDPAATVAVTVNGIAYAAENLRDGTWRLPANTVDALPVGPYNVSVSATDAAGNVGSDASTNELVIVEPPDLNPLGSDVVIELASGSVHDIVVRRVGDNLQVVDLAGPTVLSDTQLSATRSLTVIGSNNDADTIWIDFATGGTFRLPGGIEVVGGNGLGDALTVTGTGNTQAVYSMSVSPVGQTQLRVFDSLGSTTIRYSDHESLTFDGLLSFAANSMLNVGATSLTIGSQTPVDLGALTLISGGSIHSSSTLVLDSAETLIGYGNIDAPFAGETGSSVSALGNLAIGKATSPIGFATRGELLTGSHAVTLLDSNQAVLGSLTQLGQSGVAAGTLLAANGLLVDFGNNVSGWGTVQSPNDPFKLLMNNGAIAGNSLVEPIELTGYIKGVGSIDNVEIGGTYSPGFSPAVVYNGSVAYSTTGRTVLEIGGTTPGSSGHDQLNHAGSVSLGGVLQVELINGFAPQLGQSFVLMTASEGMAGDFASVQLPPAPSGSRWTLEAQTHQLVFSLVAADSVPPTIGRVVAGSSRWLGAFIDTIDGAGASAGNGLGYELVVGNRPLPWNNVDRIYVQFTEEVVGVSAASVELRSSLGVVPISVTYDPITFTATIVTAMSLNSNKYRLAFADTIQDLAGNALDGDRVGGAGGIFDFRFDVLPTDTNGDRRVSTSDLLPFPSAFNSQAGQSNFLPFVNWNGDLRINTADLALFSVYFNTRIDNLSEPGAAFGGSGSSGGLSSFSRPEDAFFEGLGKEEEEENLRRKRR